jgi:hypothetical protein
MSIRAELERRLQALPLLTRRKSRFGDSQSYFLADREIAHFHGDERMDVRLTRERIRELKADGAIDSRVHTGGPSADWATVRVIEEGDLAFAVQLVEEAIRANS